VNVTLLAFAAERRRLLSSLRGKSVARPCRGWYGMVW